MGAFKNNSIYILSPQKYAKESSHKKEEFWMSLKHEYVHYYYTQMSKSHYPVWLNEGLASYLSGKKLGSETISSDKLLNILKYFNKSDKSVYLVGQFWVEFLIKNYGKNKLLELINSFNSPLDYQQFTKKFYSIYNFKFTKNSLKRFLK